MPARQECSGGETYPTYTRENASQPRTYYRFSTLPTLLPEVAELYVLIISASFFNSPFQRERCYQGGNECHADQGRKLIPGKQGFGNCVTGN